jgi:hypothetical protein
MMEERILVSVPLGDLLVWCSLLLSTSYLDLSRGPESRFGIYRIFNSTVCSSGESVLLFELTQLVLKVFIAKNIFAFRI